MEPRSAAKPKSNGSSTAMKNQKTKLIVNQPISGKQNDAMRVLICIVHCPSKNFINDTNSNILKHCLATYRAYVHTLQINENETSATLLRGNLVLTLQVDLYQRLGCRLDRGQQFLM